MIVIDTHVLIWWIDDNPRLPAKVRSRLDAESDIRLSAISLLEIATACSLGRLVLNPSPERWMETALSVEQLNVEPLTT